MLGLEVRRGVVLGDVWLAPAVRQAPPMRWILPFVHGSLEWPTMSGYRRCPRVGGDMRSSSKTCVSTGATKPKGSPQSGFTLIELMVTMAVLAILAVVAVPAMTMLINGNRLSGMNDELTASVQLARSEAIRRNAPVTVCGSADGTTCAAVTDWNRWIVLGRDNATATNQVIRDNDAIGPVEVSGPAAGLVFRPSGRIDAEAQLTACVPTTSPNQNQRVITVMISGGIRTARVDGGGNCP